MSAKRGFTIVELLVIIVIIGILAGVSVVAYNGIRTRARNIATISAVNSWVKILKSNTMLNGTIQADDIEPWLSIVCLGRESDYPASANFGKGECVIDYGSRVGGRISSYVNNALQPNFSIPSSPSDLELVNTDYKIRGIMYRNFNGGEVHYALEGESADCSIAKAEVLSTGYYSGGFSGVTMCMVPLGNYPIHGFSYPGSG